MTSQDRAVNFGCLVFLLTASAISLYELNFFWFSICFGTAAYYAYLVREEHRE